MFRPLAALAIASALLAPHGSCAWQGGASTAPDAPTQAGLTTPSERLEGHVRFLSELDPPRSYRHPESLKKATDYIAAKLEAAGGKVEYQDFEVEETSYRNVIAFLGPKTTDRIVVGAHYDACGDLPGADDNASGVAGLLELAARLGKVKLETRVELVAYANEEPPFFGGKDMGSYHHAKRLRDREIELRGMVCLEMIGYFSDAPDSQRFPLPAMREQYPTIGNFIAVVGRPQDVNLVELVHRSMSGASELPAEKLIAPSLVPGVGLSDHRNYWSQDYLAVMITDSADYRNGNYHTRGDTADTLDYERMAKVVDGVFAAVVKLGTREKKED